MDGVHEGVQIDQGSMFCIRPKKNTKKEPGQYSAILTEEASTVKDLLYGHGGQKLLFSCKTKAENPKWARNSHKNTGKTSSCLHMKPAI